MLGLQEIRELLLICRSYQTLCDEEVILLNNENISRNPDFLYWCYDTFDLDGRTDAECKAEFWFYRNDLIFLLMFFDYQIQ